MALLFQGVLREVTTHFIVDARALNKVGGNHVKVHIISPSGTNTDSYITDKGDGTYRVEYTAFEDGRKKKKKTQHIARHLSLESRVIRESRMMYLRGLSGNIYKTIFFFFFIYRLSLNRQFHIDRMNKRAHTDRHRNH